MSLRFNQVPSLFGDSARHRLRWPRPRWSFARVRARARSTIGGAMLPLASTRTRAKSCAIIAALGEICGLAAHRIPVHDSTRRQRAPLANLHRSPTFVARASRSARGHPSHNKTNHSHAYGVGSMCAPTGKRPARARPVQFVPGTTSAYLEATVKKQTTFDISMSGLVQYAG